MLIVYDANLRHDLFFIDELARRLGVLRRQRSLTEDERNVLDFMQRPPAGGRQRSRRLPGSITGGATANLCEISLPYAHLPEGASTLEALTRETSLLPCRVDPRPGGFVELLPYCRDDVNLREDEFVRIVAQRGVAVMAMRVQGNPGLFQPGRRSLPGLVLVSFDDPGPDEVKQMHRLARRLFDLKETSPRSAAEREARSIIMANEEAGRLYRRRQLPRGFSGGSIIYAADLIIRPRYLRQAHLTNDDLLLPCVADPGAEGAIEHRPYWQVTGEPPPAGEPIDAVPAEAPAAELEAIRADSPLLVVSAAAPVLEVEAIRAESPLAVVSEVAEARTAPIPQRAVARLRSPFLLALLFLAGGMGAVVLAVGLVWLFALRAHEKIELSNARVSRSIGLLVTVDYELRHLKLDPENRYYLTARPRNGGSESRILVDFDPAQGTLTTMLPFGPFAARTEYELYIEVEQINAPGARERVSNIVTVAP